MIYLRHTKINCVKEDGTIDQELVKLYEDECAKQGVTNVASKGDTERAYLYCINKFNKDYCIEYSPKKSKVYFNSSSEKEVFLKDIQPNAIPRTKPSYEAAGVYEEFFWQISKEFVTEVFYSYLDGSYKRVGTLEDLLSNYKRNTLYRKVETTQSPMDAAKEACKKALEESNLTDGNCDFMEECVGEEDFMYDEDYIKIFRAIEKAYDGSL